MNRNLGIVLVCVGLAVMAATGVAVKMIWFPSVKDAWFLGNQRGLRTAPANLVFVRPTRFPNAPTNSVVYANVNNQMRIAGRNVSFQDLIAVAWQYNPGLIHLPDNAPKGNFDFIVCAPGLNRDRMEKLVQSKTGFSAQEETQDTDVLALKVVDPYTTNLTASAPNEKQNVNFKKGRLYFTHTKLSDITSGLESVLKTPVEDETGLTNYYNFSLAWSRNTRPDQLTRDDIDKIVGEWGLRFEPDTETIKMLVVKKVY
jgi:uncharacterized protein (TIGR03435 family)